MTLNQFISKYNGKGIDYDGSFGNQCVDLYRQYVKEVLNLPQSPPVVGAADIWTSFSPEHYDKIINTTEAIPQPGDIVIWNRRYGPYGHVAVCVSGEQLSLTCFSQNDPTGALCGLKTYKYTNIYGWLRPKVSSMAVMYKGLDLTNQEAMKVAVDIWDAVVVQNQYLKISDLKTRYGVESLEQLDSQIAGYKARITDLSNQLGTAQAEMKNREEQVGRLVMDIDSARGDVNSLIERLNIATENYERVSREKGALAIELQQTKVQLETAKQGSITLSIADIIKLILTQKVTFTK